MKYRSSISIDFIFFLSNLFLITISNSFITNTLHVNDIRHKKTELEVAVYCLLQFNWYDNVQLLLDILTLKYQKKFFIHQCVLSMLE